MTIHKNVIKNSSVGKVTELIQTHGEEKVAQGFEIMQKLFEKNLEELEIIAKSAKSEPIKKIVKMVMEQKINSI